MTGRHEAGRPGGQHGGRTVCRCPWCRRRDGHRRRGEVPDMAKQNGGQPALGSAPRQRTSAQVRNAVSDARKASSADQMVADGDQSASDADRCPRTSTRRHRIETRPARTGISWHRTRTRRRPTRTVPRIATCPPMTWSCTRALGRIERVRRSSASPTGSPPGDRARPGRGGVRSGSDGGDPRRGGPGAGRARDRPATAVERT